MNAKFVLSAPMGMLVLFVASVPALALENGTVRWFDFSGWDHNSVVADGQLFTDIDGPIDVTVTAAGQFPFGTAFDGLRITTGQEVPGTQQFNFSFAKVPAATQLVVEIPTLDSYEQISVMAPGTETYVHETGGFPIISSATPDLTLAGIDAGFPPANSPGATHGYVITDPQSQSNFVLAVSYEALSNNKFEDLRIGTLVPEPVAITYGIYLLGLLASLRRRSL